MFAPRETPPYEKFTSPGAAANIALGDFAAPLPRAEGFQDDPLATILTMAGLGSLSSVPGGSLTFSQVKALKAAIDLAKQKGDLTRAAMLEDRLRAAQGVTKP